MSTSLMTTKLYMPPASPRLVARPQLIQHLDEGLRLGHRLTLASAPAGFGKTTLLSAWLRQAERPVAWLSLDEGDNDIARFLTYLVAAFQTIDPVIGETAQAMLQAPQALPLERLFTTLLNDIDEVRQPFVLALDDYHLIETPSIHEGISFMLDHMPPSQQGLHLVIATRADPPLPLARLRGRGQLTELHAAELRFSLDETAGFLNERMGLDLSTEQVFALERRTEGWATGLQLAALSLRGRDDVSAFIQSFTGSHHYVLDYLTHEVLNRQSEEIRSFLLRTAILERLSGPLCDALLLGTAEAPGSPKGVALSGRRNSQEILEWLEIANLFLVPLDGERCWYRYHHLFADILRQRLGREMSDLVPELHRRASYWYEQQGLLADAVSHSLTSAEFDRAADLIQRAGWAAFTRGEMATILGWIAALPKDLVHSSTRLRILRAWAQAKSGDLNGAELGLQNMSARDHHGELTAVRAYIAGVRGDVARAADLSRQALKHLPEKELFLRAIVTQNLGVAYYWSGNPLAAVQTLTKAATLARMADQVFQTLTSMAILGRAHEMQAALHQAMAAYEQALDLVSEASSRPVPFASMAHVGKAGVLYEWNDLDKARQSAIKGTELSEMGGLVAYHVFGHALLARICWAQGDGGSAAAWIEKAQRIGQGISYALVMALVAETQVRLWLSEGDVTRAGRWAEERQMSPAEKLDAAQEIEQMVVARVLLAQGQTGDALDLLGWLLEAARAAGRTGHVIRIQILQALALQACDKTAAALTTLEQALSLAEPAGYVRTFIDEGEPMVHLMSQFLKTRRQEQPGRSPSLTPDYVGRLWVALGASPPLKSPSDQGLVDPLTEREIEVLQLIAGGLSNREIARELVIASSTVKTHINHIYGKLEVKSRTQATARAQELGLL